MFLVTVALLAKPGRRMMVLCRRCYNTSFAKVGANNRRSWCFELF
jgi:hypothetical protein